MSDPETVRPARRDVILGTCAAVIALATGTRAWAQAKAPQKTVQYQEKPKGDQQCDKCQHFVAPDSCKLVDGKINPKGWCLLYVVKPK